MDKVETDKLWQLACKAEAEKQHSGLEVWNKWADQILCEKEELVKQGKWSLDREPFETIFDGLPTVGSSLKSKETSEWMGKARVDFSQRTFDETANFALFKFPYDVSFAETTFNSWAVFSGCTFFDSVSFQGTKFNNLTNFRNAKFIGTAAFHSSVVFAEVALFDKSQFASDAQFNCVFHRGAMFGSCVFAGTALFGQVKFLDSANFPSAQFFGRCFFEESSFSKHASFNDARFYTEALFGRCKFDGPANFSKAHFSSADFNSIQSRNSFSLAESKFDSTPNFIQAYFSEAPRLDNIVLEDPLKKRNWGFHAPDPRPADFCEWVIAKDGDEQARSRTLKKMAISAHDYEQEVNFFSNELRTRRFWRDKPFSTGAGRFWFGILYELTSDFGRSVLRPFLWWLGNMGFLALILALVRNREGECTLWNSVVPVEIYLSFINSLPGLGVFRSQQKETALTYLLCAKKDEVFPFLDMIFIVHGFVQAILIFLCILVIRNIFKIK